MTCYWKRVGSTWAVMIPESEVHFDHGGAGHYAVEQRDGTVRTVYVDRLSAEPQAMWRDGERIWGRLGHEGDPHHERAAKRHALAAHKLARTTPRLSKDGHAVIAPVSVLERAADPEGDHGLMILDGQKVWIRPGPWKVWQTDGVRMAAAEVLALAS